MIKNYRVHWEIALTLWALVPVLGGATYSFPNFNGYTFDVWEWNTSFGYTLNRDVIIRRACGMVHTLYKADTQPKGNEAYFLSPEYRHGIKSIFLGRRTKYLWTIQAYSLKLANIAWGLSRLFKDLEKMWDIVNLTLLTMLYDVRWATQHSNVKLNALPRRGYFLFITHNVLNIPVKAHICVYVVNAVPWFMLIIIEYYITTDMIKLWQESGESY